MTVPKYVKGGGEDKTRQDERRPDKTRQDKSIQDKTRQDTTRQDKARTDKIRHDTTLPSSIRSQELPPSHLYIQPVYRTVYAAQKSIRLFYRTVPYTVSYTVPYTVSYTVYRIPCRLPSTVPSTIPCCFRCRSSRAAVQVFQRCRRVQGRDLGRWRTPTKQVVQHTIHSRMATHGFEVPVNIAFPDMGADLVYHRHVTEECLW
jgi:hypothetical protein